LIFDTDILIWYLRGHPKSKEMVESSLPFSLSAVTYMELLQGMKSKSESKAFLKQIHHWGIEIISIDKDISSRAVFYVQEYALSHGMKMADALVAATAVQTSRPLVSGNEKHYKHIPTLEFQLFKP